MPSTVEDEQFVGIDNQAVLVSAMLSKNVVDPADAVVGITITFFCSIQAQIYARERSEEVWATVVGKVVDHYEVSDAKFLVVLYEVLQQSTFISEDAY